MLVLEQQLSTLAVYILLLTEYFSGGCCQKCEMNNYVLVFLFSVQALQWAISEGYFLPI